MFVGFLIGLIIALLTGGFISWLITCGVIKVITLCFGLTFSWPVATGIWLCLTLLNAYLVKK